MKLSTSHWGLREKTYIIEVITGHCWMIDKACIAEFITSHCWMIEKGCIAEIITDHCGLIKKACITWVILIVADIQSLCISETVAYSYCISYEAFIVEKHSCVLLNHNGTL